MKIGIASDHAGYEVKERIISELNYDFKDYGTNSLESVDYPDFALKLGKDINNEIDLGILICKTGIGMSIACNKIKGVRCAKVDNETEAKLTREHNDANVMAISADKDFEEIKNMIEIFLNTSFSNDERHIRRVNKIRKIENEY